MKRYLLACSLALAFTAVTTEKASAWNKFNFNIGMNIACEGAENNLLWGLFRNGPHPFAQAQAWGGGQGGQGGQGGYGGPGGYGGYGADQGGGNPYFNPMPATAGPAPGMMPAPVHSTPVQALPANNGQTTPVMYGATPQTTGTQQIGYYGWPTTNSYAPYYWYGN